MLGGERKEAWWAAAHRMGEVSAVVHQKLRVHLVDDDYLVRLGVEKLFEGSPLIDVESVSSTGNSAIEEALSLRPDVVLMETMIRDVDGIRAVREIMNRAPQVKVAMLSSNLSFDVMRDAYRAGAVSYLSKSAVSSDLGAAIRMIHHGETIFSASPDVGRFPIPVMTQDASDHQVINSLPARDRSILSGLTAGRTNAQIALDLHVSEATVKLQITKIMAKLNVGGRVELAVFAVRAGFHSA